MSLRRADHSKNRFFRTYGTELCHLSVVSSPTVWKQYFHRICVSTHPLVHNTQYTILVHTYIYIYTHLVIYKPWYSSENNISSRRSVRRRPTTTDDRRPKTYAINDPNHGVVIVSKRASRCPLVIIILVFTCCARERVKNHAGGIRFGRRRRHVFGTQVSSSGNDRRRHHTRSSRPAARR